MAKLIPTPASIAKLSLRSIRVGIVFSLVALRGKSKLRLYDFCEICKAQCQMQSRRGQNGFISVSLEYRDVPPRSNFGRSLLKRKSFAGVAYGIVGPNNSYRLV